MALFCHDTIPLFTFETCEAIEKIMCRNFNCVGHRQQKHEWNLCIYSNKFIVMSCIWLFNLTRILNYKIYVYVILDHTFCEINVVEKYLNISCISSFKIKTKLPGRRK